MCIHYAFFVHRGSHNNYNALFFQIVTLIRLKIFEFRQFMIVYRMDYSIQCRKIISDTWLYSLAATV
jgi:hypothetical protein